MSRACSIDEQLRALSKAQVCEPSRRLLGPDVARLSAEAHRAALVDFYTRSPRLRGSCQAPEMPKEDYDEIFGLLRGMPWDRIARRSVPAALRCAMRRESFVMCGVLGKPDSTAFETPPLAKWATTTKSCPQPS